MKRTLVVLVVAALASCGGREGATAGPIVDSGKVVGTWSVSWAQSSCVAGNTTVSTGGNTSDYVVTAVDAKTISFGWSGSTTRYQLTLALAQDGGMEASWEHASEVPSITCRADSLAPKNSYKETIHFNSNYSTGHVITEWSFGLNTACPGCSATVRSEMTRKVSSVARASSVAEEAGGLAGSGKAVSVDAEGGADYAAE